MEKPLVSVIVPNYNYADYLPDCIHSVLSQTVKNLECIVVDDGSTDNSVEVLQQFAAADPRLRIIKKSNSGCEASRNEGLKQASGKYIAFVDSDDKWSDTKLENQLDILNKTNADFVYSNFYGFDNSGTLKKNKNAISNLTIYDFIGGNPISGSASSVMMKREVFERVGFFDTELHGVEDVTYWFRCFLHKFRFAHCPSYDVFIRNHSGSMTKTFNSRMFDYNLSALSRELSMLKEMKYDLDSKKFLQVLSGRLRAARWYARHANSHKRVLKSYLSGIKIYGIGYFFQKNVFEDAWIDVKRILKP